MEYGQHGALIKNNETIQNRILFIQHSLLVNCYWRGMPFFMISLIKSLSSVKSSGLKGCSSILVSTFKIKGVNFLLS